MAELLSEAGAEAAVCVATEYGGQVMPSLPGIELFKGRKDKEAMRRLMEQEDFLAVVDATHPFAAEVSRNILSSAGETGTEYIRLLRDTGGVCAGELLSGNEECADALLETEGNILLTTGSKELSVYCRAGLGERLYVRVLPCEESIRICREQGITGSRIIAMQGPFSGEMNEALIRQYDIRHLVTKESGSTGGFQEKVRAAEKTGTKLWVIARPQEQKGFTFREVCGKLEEMTGKILPVNCHEGKDRSESRCEGRCIGRLKVTLAGTGMGDEGTLTGDAREAVKRAGYVFGAPRLLEAVRKWRGSSCSGREYPYYTAEDILPVMETLWENVNAAERGTDRGDGHETEAVILFSGDSGFYSGCGKMYAALEAWRADREEITLRILPGISSVSYMAAVCGIPWQDAKILSVHGRGERTAWEGELLAAIRHNGKVFVLVSGVRDVRQIGEMLKKRGMENCRVIAGYSLGGAGEELLHYTPEQCAEAGKEGLYTLVILNRDAQKYSPAPWKEDTVFLRGKVPMTKEAVRALCVCMMELTEDAVVYDVGSGTGSVTVEMAERSGKIRVYALEQKEEGVDLTRRNCEKSGLGNVEIIQGTAPECFDGLPAPTHAFIGGSGGKLSDILETLYNKNPGMRVVITAVTLETAAQIEGILRQMPVKDELLYQIQVNKAKKAGKYHLMQAEDPIWICRFDFDNKGYQGREGEEKDEK